MAGWRVVRDPFAEEEEEPPYAGPDLGREAADRWHLCHRGLLALAGPRKGEAFELLDELEQLLYRRMAEVEETAWRELGLGLVRLGYGGLWPALFALTALGRDCAYRPGDEQRFLEAHDPRLREPPEGWPWLWASPPAPERAGGRTGGTGT